MSDAARRAALDLLDAVRGQGRILSDLLPGAVAALAPEDRARAQRLATETLRWADRADRMLGPHLRKRPPLRALNALRLGTWEICGDGAAPHGTVNTLVGIMRSERETAAQAGLINAVLRRVAGAAEKWDTLPMPQLPRPLRRRLAAAWGKEAVAAIEASHAAGAPLDLTPKDGDAASLAKRLDGVALATGSVRLARPGQVTALPGYDGGDWWVQDAAAALPVRLAAPRPGERALDLCAAPGGKTLQLAAAGAEVTAIDISAARMERLERNLERCGLRARTVVADALEWEEGGGFDIVLLDAPCSATGTIRRHPDLPHARDLSDLGPLLDLQARLFDRAVASLAPGGRLVWCTCSLLPEEGEAQVQAAVARNRGLHVPPTDAPGTGEWGDGAGGIRTRPDFWSGLGGLDGFHMARLERDGAGADGDRTSPFG